MAYFNYHAKLKRLIQDGYLISYCYKNNYKKIGNVLILNFGYKTYPIREKWFNYYLEFIKCIYQIKRQNKVFITTLKK